MDPRSAGLQTCGEGSVRTDKSELSEFHKWDIEIKSKIKSKIKSRIKSKIKKRIKLVYMSEVQVKTDIPLIISNICTNYEIIHKET